MVRKPDKIQVDGLACAKCLDVPLTIPLIHLGSVYLVIMRGLLSCWRTVVSLKVSIYFLIR